MGKKWFVPRCNVRYKTWTEKLSLFATPKEEDHLKAWREGDPAQRPSTAADRLLRETFWVKVCERIMESCLQRLCPRKCPTESCSGKRRSTNKVSGLSLQPDEEQEKKRKQPADRQCPTSSEQHCVTECSGYSYLVNTIFKTFIFAWPGSARVVHNYFFFVKCHLSPN